MKKVQQEILLELIQKYPLLQGCIGDINRAADAMIACYTNHGKLLICGNGGSASDADHIVGELMKGFIQKRPVSHAFRVQLRAFCPDSGDYLADRLQGALPAISLSQHSALLSAFSNDVEPNMAYAQQVFGYGNKGDLLIGLSTSGNSANIVHAVQVAKAKELCTIGLTGGSGGLLKDFCDITIVVPEVETYKIQELHLPIYHALCRVVESAFFE